MSSPKVKVVAVVFQNNQGERYYSKYYAASKGNLDLTSKEAQKKLERGLLDKVARMNVVSKLKPEDSNSHLNQMKSSLSQISLSSSKWSTSS